MPKADASQPAALGDPPPRLRRQRGRRHRASRQRQRGRAGGFVFRSAAGEPIPRPLPDVPSRADDIPPLRALLDLAATGDIGPGSAATRDGSARIDLDYVVTTILDGVERARAPAAAPSGC